MRNQHPVPNSPSAVFRAALVEMAGAAPRLPCGSPPGQNVLMSELLEPVREGHCTCRLVRYRIRGHPLFVHCCHCRWCQRETGAAFALNALIETSRLELLSGQVERVATPSNSGKGQQIVRCNVCRIALWSHYAGAGPVLSFVRVGTLEDPDSAPPDIHIFTSSKQPWVVLPGGVPAVPEYYDRDQYWPRASLERRKVMLGR